MARKGTRRKSLSRSCVRSRCWRGRVGLSTSDTNPTPELTFQRDHSMGAGRGDARPNTTLVNAR